MRRLAAFCIPTILVVLALAAAVADGPASAPAAPVAAPNPFPRRALRRERPLVADSFLAVTDPSIHEGLRWLAAHRSANGGWEAAGFPSWCGGVPHAGPKADGGGRAQHDIGVTGLALCAFLGAGYADRGEHEFAPVVKAGLTYLKGVQDAQGSFATNRRPRHLYDHGAASLAMVEAFAMTGDPDWQACAQKALDFVASARDPHFGWGYGSGYLSDTFTTSWMAHVLGCARWANADSVRRGLAPPLRIDEQAYPGIHAWFEKMTDPDYGRTGYRSRGQGPDRNPGLEDKFPNDNSEAPSAAAMFARIVIGQDPRKPGFPRAGDKLLRGRPPVWDRYMGHIDMAYWYFGSLAVQQLGGMTWEQWKPALVKAIVPAQRKDGDACSFRGSWDPIDPWGVEGGRIYSTALMVMCLQSPYRYERLFPAR